MEELLIMYGQSSHVFTLQTLGYGLYMPFVFFWLSFFFFFFVSHHEHQHLYFNT